MLVLSRKVNETLSFPNLGISVEILRVHGKTVRIGVDAPRDIRILRGELEDNEPEAGKPNSRPKRLSNAEREERHAMRNRLNTASLALHLLQKQLDAGRFEDAENSLMQAVEGLEELNRLATAQDTSTPSPPGSNPYRALIVEDNANERELLAGFLEMYGYEVDAVEDGKAAMEYLDKHERPDMILLDMHMPRMDGPATIAAIRKHPNYHDIKLFAVSGEEQQNVELPASDRGVDHWFSKPLKPSEFANNLAEELKRASFSN